MSYHYFERPPVAEGIWKCQRCMMLRPFVTTPELEGRDIPDAPLFCLECDWELLPEVDIIQRYPEPPVEIRRPMDPTVRAAGRERWRQYLLSQAAPRTPKREAVPLDADALALQTAQLRGRRAA